MATKRKRLVRGKDYDGWALRYEDGTYLVRMLFKAPDREQRNMARILHGKWVRVKFVEVT